MSTVNTAYLLLGSNEGNRESWINQALDLLNKQVGDICKQSSLYQTAAWGIEDQPDFLNLALCIQTELTVEMLLDTILSIELKLGRERILKWGQRTIDIDILFYNDLILSSKNLIVPHPYIQERNFALVPLKEIAPHLIHPILKQDISQLLDNCTDKLIANKYK